MIDVLLIVRRYGVALVGVLLVAMLLPSPLNQLLCVATLGLLIATLLSGMLASVKPAAPPSGGVEPSRMADDPWAPTADESPPVTAPRGVPDDMPRGTSPLPAFTSAEHDFDDEDPHKRRYDE